jgi:hypothetical protein
MSLPGLNSVAQRSSPLAQQQNAPYSAPQALNRRGPAASQHSALAASDLQSAPLGAQADCSSPRRTAQLQTPLVAASPVMPPVAGESMSGSLILPPPLLGEIGSLPAPKSRRNTTSVFAPHLTRNVQTQKSIRLVREAKEKIKSDELLQSNEDPQREGLRRALVRLKDVKKEWTVFKASNGILPLNRDIHSTVKANQDEVKYARKKISGYVERVKQLEIHISYCSRLIQDLGPQIEREQKNARMINSAQGLDPETPEVLQGHQVDRRHTFDISKEEKARAEIERDDCNLQIQRWHEYIESFSPVIQLGLKTSACEREVEWQRTLLDPSSAHAENEKKSADDELQFDLELDKP